MRSVCSVCKNPACHRAFRHERAGAQYCSVKCRVAVHRFQQKPSPPTSWLGDDERFSATTRSRNADGTPALSSADLAARLVELARKADGGKPKTGRRFYYLALSYGYILPDMSATVEGKKSRDAAYDRITNVLGKLRRTGKLSWDAVLDLTRELVEWQVYASPREARATLLRRYSEDRWLGQPGYPILIVEKDTLEPVCKPMASIWQMPSPHRAATARSHCSMMLPRCSIGAMPKRDNSSPSFSSATTTPAASTNGRGRKRWTISAWCIPGLCASD